MADKVRIDADQLTEVRLSADGSRVDLTLLDQGGNKICLSLPAGCLNAIITALPGRVDPGVVHKLDSWTMGVAEDGRESLLTLRTPEGAAISFTLKPWQVDGMATIASYGGGQRVQPKILH